MMMVRYRGTSMWPLFQEGDLLELESASIEAVGVGDCVAYRNSDGFLIVHRVVAAGSQLRTRGDALIKGEHEAVSLDQLVGRVTHRYRAGMVKRINGGWAALLAGKCYALAGRIDPQRPTRGGRIARTIRRGSMVLQGWFWRRGTVREIELAGQRQVVVWYWRNSVVGRRDMRNGEWLIYWPWRVILDEFDAKA